MLSFLTSLWKRIFPPREPWKAQPPIRAGLPSPFDVPAVLPLEMPLPCSSDWVQIFRTNYVEDVNDCSNMSAEYCRRLRAAGYIADVWFMEHISQGDHAVVAVWIESKRAWLWCDPTGPMTTWDHRRWGRIEYRFADDWLYSTQNKEASWKPQE